MAMKKKSQSSYIHKRISIMGIRRRRSPIMLLINFYPAESYGSESGIAGVLSIDAA